MVIALCLNHTILSKCAYLLHWLQCLFACLFLVMIYILIFMMACIWYRFETGPGRCTGRAGPHIQPRDWLGLAQCQRDVCYWWPGYMKANTVCPVLLSPPPLPPPSPPPPQSSSTSHALHPPQRCWEKTRCRGKSRGRRTVLPPCRLLLSPQGEKLTLSSLYPFFHSTPSFLLLAIKLREYLSLHTRQSVTWE